MAVAILAVDAPVDHAAQHSQEAPAHLSDSGAAHV